MSYSSGTRLPLKVMINKEKNKVLFAEANSDFVNVLLSFLALPLGKAQKNFIALGSINTLYRGLNEMDESYFCVRGCKEMLVNPRSSLGDECRKLALDITYSPPKKYYCCEDEECTEDSTCNVSIYSDIATCDCGKSLNREIRVAECREGGGFITNPSSFIVTDDLFVVPLLTGLFQTLCNIGITDTQGAEMKSLTFDISKIRDLLRLAVSSPTPLTDMMFNKTLTISPTSVKAELGVKLHDIPKEKLLSRKMVLKVFLQKSTSKFLYAEATDEFVDLLFSFLNVPIGGVEFLFGGNTCFRNLDNLSTSVSNGIDDKCFRSPETKTILINPNLPYCCISKSQFLPFSEGPPPKLFYTSTDYYKLAIKNTSFSDRKSGDSSIYSFKSSRGLYVKEHSKFIVTDDLTVSPSLATSILILNSLQISYSDVKEMEFHIGLDEALSILKTSLTSRTVLTDALINPMLNKLPELKPKQEP